MQQWSYFYFTSLKSKPEIYTDLIQEKFQNSNNAFFPPPKLCLKLFLVIFEFILKEKKYLVG